jgi:hypothetical protein
MQQERSLYIQSLFVCLYGRFTIGSRKALIESIEVNGFRAFIFFKRREGQKVKFFFCL